MAYGDVKGLRAPRAAIWGRPAGKEVLNDDNSPPLSGINAPQNSLTMDGPATEPMGVNDIEQKKMKLAMAMMGNGMTGFSQGMQQHNIPNVMPQQSPFDLYGNPTGGM